MAIFFCMKLLLETYLALVTFVILTLYFYLITLLTPKNFNNNLKQASNCINNIDSYLKK